MVSDAGPPRDRGRVERRQARGKTLGNEPFSLIPIRRRCGGWTHSRLPGRAGRNGGQGSDSIETLLVDALLDQKPRKGVATHSWPLPGGTGVQERREGTVRKVQAPDRFEQHSLLLRGNDLGHSRRQRGTDV